MRAAPIVAIVLALLLAGPVTAEERDESRWEAMRGLLFEERPIRDGSEILALEAPYRAHDAAVVPISLDASFPQSEDRYIKTITLLIDENPLPMAGRFHFTPASGLASFSTRVRVNAYTYIRAIAETSDGELFMTKRYVKATGGCSAPAGKDPDAALARLGKMKLRPGEALAPGEPNRAQILISHPNHTGMQMDQMTRRYVPAYFVNNIEVRYGDQPVLTVESDISLSEDPSIHFHYVPDGSGELSVKVLDSKEQVFARSWQLSGPDMLAQSAETSVLQN